MQSSTWLVVHLTCSRQPPTVQARPERACWRVMPRAGMLCCRPSAISICIPLTTAKRQLACFPGLCARNLQCSQHEGAAGVTPAVPRAPAPLRQTAADSSSPLESWRCKEGSNMQETSRTAGPPISSCGWGQFRLLPPQHNTGRQAGAAGPGNVQHANQRNKVPAAPLEAQTAAAAGTAWSAQQLQLDH